MIRCDKMEGTLFQAKNKANLSLVTGKQLEENDHLKQYIQLQEFLCA